MEITAFITLIENTVDGIEPGSLAESTQLAQVPQWDSLAVLSMLAQFDAEFGVQVSGMEMQQCRTVGELFRMVQSKVAQRG